jgi:phosphatidylglycerol:prolipoprotein diacylglycerol transferase
MHPVLFRLGPLTIHTYGTLLACGILLGLWLAQRRARAAGLNPDDVWNLGVYMVLAALAGAKLWLLLAFWDYYRTNPADIFSFSTLQAGGVWYGGMLTALAVAVFYTRRKKIALLPLTDVFAAPLALGHGIGRLGCFSAGCCYGKPTTGAWGVIFHDEYAHQLVGTPLGIRLHPTQLYEASAEFLIFLLLLRLSARPHRSGQVFGAYLMLYGLARFTIEFFRGDPGRTMILGDAGSIMQVVSIGLVGLGIWMWTRGASTDSSTSTPAGTPATAGVTPVPAAPAK